jgi:hypothetical protein
MERVFGNQADFAALFRIRKADMQPNLYRTIHETYRKAVTTRLEYDALDFAAELLFRLRALAGIDRGAQAGGGNEMLGTLPIDAPA